MIDPTGHQNSLQVIDIGIANMNEDQTMKAHWHEIGHGHTLWPIAKLVATTDLAFQLC